MTSPGAAHAYVQASAKGVSACESHMFSTPGARLPTSPWLEPMKSHAQALLPDERDRIIMVDDPDTGLRPITFEDHYEMVARLGLQTTVPEVIAPIASQTSWSSSSTYCCPLCMSRSPTPP